MVYKVNTAFYSEIVKQGTKHTHEKLTTLNHLKQLPKNKSIKSILVIKIEANAAKYKTQCLCTERVAITH